MMVFFDITKIEENILSHTSEAPLLRKLMSKEEIKVANRLLKEEKLQKGRSDDKQKTVCYYAI